MDPDEPLLVRVREGIALREAGKPQEARDLFARLWPQVEGGDAFTKCFLAHSMADVQDDKQEELRWDLVALAAYAHVSEERAEERGVPGGRRGNLPSLHLNLAACYRALGDDAEAQRHYELGLAHLDALDDGDYGNQIRAEFRDFASGRPRPRGAAARGAPRAGARAHGHRQAATGAKRSSD